MVQNALVKDIIKEGVVRVSLMRQMECGMHCDGACAGCTQKPTEEILVLAEKQSPPAPEPAQLHPGIPVDFGGWQVLLTDDRAQTTGFPLTLTPEELPLTVRSRREGDALSMAFGTKPVKKLLIDRKIPKDLRDNIPIVCNNKKILAVGDLCAAYMPQREGGHYRLICRRKEI